MQEEKRYIEQGNAVQQRRHKEIDSEEDIVAMPLFFFVPFTVYVALLGYDEPKAFDFFELR